MTVAIQTKRGRPRQKKRSLVPKKWRNLICTIPGYDPFRDCKGCFFDATKAEHYIEFIETCCTHIEGALAGEPFLMEDWEKAIIANIFGWYKKDSLGRTVRRYRKVFIYVPRKNGKTPLVAAIHNAVFFLDDEAGQVNNLAAASRDQASKLFRHIEGMIKNEYEMQKRCDVYKTTRSITKPDLSVTKVIPADDNVAHGDNPHFQAVDELHAQPNRKLYDAIISAMASANRIQPLTIFITTADYDRPSICNAEYRHAVKVRDGLNDQSYLPVIYEAITKDSDGRLTQDDWKSEKTWQKANPNLNVSVSMDYLRDACMRAQEDPTFENTFKRLHLNIRTEQAERIIPMDAWDKCGGKIDWETFSGQPCWAALDIGAIRDFVCLAILFGSEEGEQTAVDYEDINGDKKVWNFIRRDYWLKLYSWLPQTPNTRDPRMENLIDLWTRQGHIIRTPGDVVDYDQVGVDITKFLKPYSLQQLAIDQGFQGMQITQDLQNIYGDNDCLVHSDKSSGAPTNNVKNVKCTCRIRAFRQGILSMAAPFRELMQIIMQQRLHHDNNPVLRWMASNVAAESRGGLTKPSKDKSVEKIDGITAATMSIGIAMTAEPIQESIYEKRGPIIL